jgi:inorganic triphosphatase YgiF
MAQKGSDLAKETGDKASDMANQAADAGKDAMAAGLEMANQTFEDTKEITVETADAAKSEYSVAVTSLEEEFNEIQAKLDPPQTEAIQEKLTTLKTELAQVGDKTGDELLSALAEIKTHGAEIASELKSLKEDMAGETATTEPSDAAEAGEAASSEATTDTTTSETPE